MLQKNFVVGGGGGVGGLFVLLFVCCCCCCVGGQGGGGGDLLIWSDFICYGECPVHCFCCCLFLLAFVLVLVCFRKGYIIFEVLDLGLLRLLKAFCARVTGIPIVLVVATVFSVGKTNYNRTASDL